MSERTSGLPGLPPGPSVPSENSIRLGFASGRIIASFGSMFAILHALGMFVADMFKSRSRLETVWYFENRGGGCHCPFSECPKRTFALTDG